MISDNFRSSVNLQSYYIIVLFFGRGLGVVGGYIITLFSLTYGV